MISEALRVTLAVIDAFVEIGVRYHLGGSFASSIHGVPRQTRDVDLVADLRTEHVDGLVSLLADAFYTDGGMIAEAISRHSSFNLVHFESGFKVDVFVLGEGPFDQAEFERSAPTRLVQEPPRDVFVKTWRTLSFANWPGIARAATSPNCSGLTFWESSSSKPRAWTRTT